MDSRKIEGQITGACSGNEVVAGRQGQSDPRKGYKAVVSVGSLPLPRQWGAGSRVQKMYVDSFVTVLRKDRKLHAATPLATDDSPAPMIALVSESVAVQ